MNKLIVGAALLLSVAATIAPHVFPHAVVAIEYPPIFGSLG